MRIRIVFTSAQISFRLWLQPTLGLYITLLVCTSVFCGPLEQYSVDELLQQNYLNYGNDLEGMSLEENDEVASLNFEFDESRDNVWQSPEDNTAKNRQKRENAEATDGLERFKRLWKNWEERMDQSREKRLWRNWKERSDYSREKRLWENWDTKNARIKRLWRNWKEDEGENGALTTVSLTEEGDPNHALLKRNLENSDEESIGRSKRLEELPETVGNSNDPDNILKIMALKRLWRDAERIDRMCLPCGEKRCRRRNQDNFFVISNELTIPCCCKM